MKEQKENDNKGSAPGGMLSSTDFLRLVITEKVDDAKKDFWNREFEKYGGKFIISPFNPQNLTPFSYDLSVGEEIYSCGKSVVKELEEEEDKTYLMFPRETIVIKTKEFIALPPCYSATVWPRFKMPTEAIFQSMVKIDPTWYGELGVSITNLSPGMYPIKYGIPFATLILYELKTDTGMFLWRKENLPKPEGVEIEGLNEPIITQIKDELKSKNLEHICEIDGKSLIIKSQPDDEIFKALIELNEDVIWRNTLMKCLGSIPREMNGLGLTTLELIRPKPIKTKKLTREEVHKTIHKCTLTDLENTALDQGVPFDQLAAIPELIMKNVEKEVIPHLEAEIGARLFPQIVQLTLRVLVLLSLIGVLVALAGKFFELKVTWLGVVSVFVILLMYIFLIVVLSYSTKAKHKVITKE